ncbi:MAG TPA: ASPIC/UnbV domain-containing protein, partial [Candidatus Binatia bacterium]|nr:ASPIC/UnbV domain-containing protein [Candidatus Binatia bacterium]
SGSSLVQHFGLGDAPRADVVEIEWPSGARTRLDGVAADRRHVVTEGDGPALSAPPPPAAPAG